jgi:anti-anti-sigma factor
MLSIDSHDDGSRHLLLLSGELDLASARELEDCVRELSARPPGELVLDLAGLEFVDSAGLSALLRVRALCQEQMWEFCLLPAERPVHRLFEITRLTSRLPFRSRARDRRANARDA